MPSQDEHPDQPDAPVGSQLYDELAAGTLPQSSEAQALRARDEHGAWSQEHRGALATELRASQALTPSDPDAANSRIDRVIAALEDRA